MKIPFGENRPSEEQQMALSKLGITVDTEKTGRYYFLTAATSARLKYIERRSDFDKINGSIEYNGVEVASVMQKTAVWDPWVMFSINVSKVDEVIAKDAERTKPPEEEKAEEPAVAAYHAKLESRLLQLTNIIFEGGAARGYATSISVQFPYLQELRKEDPVEHDKVIKSSDRYTELFKMFPDWTDPSNLQAKYEAMDVGPFMAMAAAGSRTGEGSGECCIM